MEVARQLELLTSAADGDSFAARLLRDGMFPIRAEGIGILQLNVTRQCNLSCRHCHVEAGPGRSLHMPPEVVDRCLTIAADPRVHTVDITGGAPEMHPRFREILERISALRKRLLVRSNLLILREPAYLELAPLYARTGVELVASLPDVRGERTDRQRGAGAFAGIVAMMRHLNGLGYGEEGGRLVLDIVHNPAGAYVPGDQRSIEAEYRRILLNEHGVRFNRLFCLTNCPIGRYLEFLDRTGNLAPYMRELRAAFNPAAVGSVMCRSMISVGPDGSLYDCDFNQMLGLTVNSGAPTTVFEFDPERLARREIVVGDHCFTCTAGAGSSCQGATT
jgi:radical SAM/Cys-rich protein